MAFAVYWATVAAGRKAGIWRKVNLTFYGPVMMLRTRKGRWIFEALARNGRFWRACGTFSVYLTVCASVALMAFMVWAILSTGSGHGLPSGVIMSGPGQPDLGIVAIVPYIILGLGTAVLVHESLHGILSVAGNIKVESMGVLLALVPIGAFVEPNESELSRASTMTRLRLFSAGPAANLIVALLLMVILIGFLGPAAKPISSGAIVTQVGSGSPAEVSGISVWSEVTGVGGERISTSADFQNISFNYPGELTSINATYQTRHIMLALPGGMVVTSVTDGPAFNAGIRPGMIISRFDDMVIHNHQELNSAVENASRAQPVNVTVLRLGDETTAGVSWFVADEKISTINMTSKWIYYCLHYPSLNKEEYKNVSFMGASVSPFGLSVDDPEHVLQPITHPFAGAKGVSGIAAATLGYVALPFYGNSPVASPVANLYVPSGALSFLPGDLYWILVNSFYWIFWVNLMLGLTNALPALPMDGALVLRDLLRSLARKVGARLTGFDLTIGRKPYSDRQIDRFMVLVTVLVFAMIIYLLVWQMFGPF